MKKLTLKQKEEIIDQYISELRDVAKLLLKDKDSKILDFPYFMSVAQTILLIHNAKRDEECTCDQ